MTAFTDDDVTAEMVSDAWDAWNDADTHDQMRAALAAVAPAIAARECARVAEGLQRSIEKIPRPMLDSGAYEYWRGYRAAAVEARDALRARADATGTPEATDE